MKIFVGVLICLVGSALPVMSQTQLERSAKSLAEQISGNLLDKNKRKIAVVDFSYFEDKLTALDRILTEELITQLFIVSNGKFEIVERRLLNRILVEQKMELSGLLEPSNSEKIGKILGVDAIVTGSISDLIENLKVNARLIDVTTGMVFAVAAVEIPKTGLIKQLYSTVYGQGEPSPINPKVKRTKFTKEFDGINFSLKKCRYSSGKIICEFEMISLNDVVVKFDYMPIYDSLGNTYAQNSMQIGNSSGWSYQLIEQIKTNGKLIHHNVSPRPDFIAKLDCKFSVGNTKHEFNFRNIPVED